MIIVHFSFAFNFNCFSCIHFIVIEKNERRKELKIERIEHKKFIVSKSLFDIEIYFGADLKQTF